MKRGVDRLASPSRWRFHRTRTPGETTSVDDTPPDGATPPNRAAWRKCRPCVVWRTVFAGILCVAVSPVFAQSSVRMENALPVGPLRTGAPLMITGELQSDRPDLLEGRLRFLLKNGPETLGVIETDVIAIVPGGQMRFRQLLPVPEGMLGFGLSGITTSFVTEDTEIPLGDVIVPRLPGNTWQAVLLGVEPTRGAGLGHGERLQRELAFEKAMPDPTGNAADGVEFGIVTSRPTLAVSDLPEQPLAYCAFDAVLLPGESYAHAPARTLAAITAWVRAGGAVCVVVDRPLKEKQVAFLNDLFRDSDATPFLRDEDGRLLEPPGTSQGVFAQRAGLGFAIVLFDSSDKFDFDTPVWREAHARFWRLREKYVELRRDGKSITADLFYQHPPAGRPADGFVAPQQFAVAPDNPFTWQLHPRGWSFPAGPIGTAIVANLRPESIRLMPGWAIVAILFGYVAIVGPLDYFVLGRLRLQKWTWLTFPAATLAVTWGVVATANAFMSENDHLRTVEIVDLDTNGEPVRRTTLDLHFRGSTTPVVHEVENAFFARLDPAHFAAQQMETRFVMGPNGVMRPVTEQQGATGNNAPTGPYAGTIASRYVVSQQIAKWTPQINRTFEIAPKGDVPNIDWSTLERQTGTSAMTTSLPGGQLGNVIRFGVHGYGLEGGPVTMASGRDSLLGAAATATFPTERWSLQFQRSPLGLGRLDDLPFVDVTADGLDAIAVWTKSPEGNITIYRKPVFNK